MSEPIDTNTHNIYQSPIDRLIGGEELTLYKKKIGGQKLNDHEVRKLEIRGNVTQDQLSKSSLAARKNLMTQLDAYSKLSVKPEGIGARLSYYFKLGAAFISRLGIFRFSNKESLKTLKEGPTEKLMKPLESHAETLDLYEKLPLESLKSDQGTYVNSMLFGLSDTCERDKLRYVFKETCKGIKNFTAQNAKALSKDENKQILEDLNQRNIKVIGDLKIAQKAALDEIYNLRENLNTTPDLHQALVDLRQHLETFDNVAKDFANKEGYGTSALTNFRKTDFSEELNRLIDNPDEINLETTEAIFNKSFNFATRTALIDRNTLLYMNGLKAKREFYANNPDQLVAAAKKHFGSGIQPGEHIWSQDRSFPAHAGKFYNETGYIASEFLLPNSQWKEKGITELPWHAQEVKMPYRILQEKKLELKSLMIPKDEAKKAAYEAKKADLEREIADLEKDPKVIEVNNKEARLKEIDKEMPKAQAKNIIGDIKPLMDLKAEKKKLEGELRDLKHGNIPLNEKLYAKPANFKSDDAAKEITNYITGLVLDFAYNQRNYVHSTGISRDADIGLGYSKEQGKILPTRKNVIPITETIGGKIHWKRAEEAEKVFHDSINTGLSALTGGMKVEEKAKSAVPGTAGTEVVTPPAFVEKFQLTGTESEEERKAIREAFKGELAKDEVAGPISSDITGFTGVAPQFALRPGDGAIVPAAEGAEAEAAKIQGGDIRMDWMYAHQERGVAAMVEKFEEEFLNNKKIDLAKYSYDKTDKPTHRGDKTWNLPQFQVPRDIAYLSYAKDKISKNNTGITLLNQQNESLNAELKEAITGYDYIPNRILAYTAPKENADKVKLIESNKTRIEKLNNDNKDLDKAITYVDSRIKYAESGKAAPAPAAPGPAAATGKAPLIARAGYTIKDVKAWEAEAQEEMIARDAEIKGKHPEIQSSAVIYQQLNSKLLSIIKREASGDVAGAKEDIEAFKRLSEQAGPILAALYTPLFESDQRGEFFDNNLIKQFVALYQILEEGAKKTKDTTLVDAWRGQYDYIKDFKHI